MQVPATSQDVNSALDIVAPSVREIKGRAFSPFAFARRDIGLAGEVSVTLTDYRFAIVTTEKDQN